ncbi:cyclophilin-like fold protein [Halalkalibacter sp. AB-rgal2]|uniref:cyclophilin-like fold protein n=1 Tax=Halalkalibacter sp. AB-rgal2 TaxID=3242695 RepID=UPI00359E90BE
MKKMLLILYMFIISFGLTACFTSETNESEEINAEEIPRSESNQESEETNVARDHSSEVNQERGEAEAEAENTLSINITIGDQVFSAKLYNNQTTQAFIQKLPLDINMSDVNSNEKFYRFPDALPTNSERPGEINAGDIMLYGDNGLVLFYETFSSSYSYTRLGYIEEAVGFAQAAGDGDINIAFDLAENIE